MKSEARGGPYVIILGSLKPDSEWLSWMVIVTLPPREKRSALGLLHRDIQSYSLLHIMELSSQHANGSDPFNLCQKHTDEEVPNARPLPWGRHTLPLAAPFPLLDSLTGAPHLSSFTVQSGETGRPASCRPLHMPPLHARRAQGHGRRVGPGSRRSRRGPPARDGRRHLLELRVNAAGLGNATGVGYLYNTAARIENHLEITWKVWLLSHPRTDNLRLLLRLPVNDGG